MLSVERAPPPMRQTGGLRASSAENVRARGDCMNAPTSGKPPTTHGDRASPHLSDTFPIGYAELRQLAQHLLQRRHGAPLRTTSLVHETWLRLARRAGMEHPEREHLLAIAARAMRCVLVDHARRRAALKRGMGKPDATLDALDSPDAVLELTSDVDCLALHEALERLARFDERKARAVELRFFGGLELEEIAEVLSISTATVKRDWLLARAWLYRELHDGRQER
jgi:RNA polymerase sigma factor (TIGR02999 family)